MTIPTASSGGRARPASSSLWSSWTAASLTHRWTIESGGISSPFDRANGAWSTPVAPPLRFGGRRSPRPARVFERCRHESGSPNRRVFPQARTRCPRHSESVTMTPAGHGEDHDVISGGAPGASRSQTGVHECGLRSRGEQPGSRKLDMGRRPYGAHGALVLHPRLARISQVRPLGPCRLRSSGWER